MKTILLMITFSWLSLISLAQGIRSYLPFNEYGVNINCSYPLTWYNYGFQSKLGVGFTANYSFKPDNVFNPVLGLNYQFIWYHINSIPTVYGRYEDINVLNQLLRVPLTFRLQLGSKQRFILEPGIFGGVLLHGRIHGSKYDYLTEKKLENIKDKTGPGLNVGLSMAIGAQFPLSKGKIVCLAKCNGGMGLNHFAAGTSNETGVFYSFFPECSVVYQLP
jgi:hypothetical protein